MGQLGYGFTVQDSPLTLFKFDHHIESITKLSQRPAAAQATRTGVNPHWARSTSSDSELAAGSGLTALPVVSNTRLRRGFVRRRSSGSTGVCTRLSHDVIKVEHQLQQVTHLSPTQVGEAGESRPRRPRSEPETAKKPFFLQSPASAGPVNPPPPFHVCSCTHCCPQVLLAVPSHLKRRLFDSLKRQPN